MAPMGRPGRARQQCRYHRRGPARLHHRRRARTRDGDQCHRAAGLEPRDAAFAAASGPSRIVNVGSMFGDIAYPLFAAYSASKFALRGLSIALRRELKPYGIGVTYAAPRATKTDASHAMDPLVEPMQMRLDDPTAVATPDLAGGDARSRQRLRQGPGAALRSRAAFSGLVDQRSVRSARCGYLGKCYGRARCVTASSTRNRWRNRDESRNGAGIATASRHNTEVKV